MNRIRSSYVFLSNSSFKHPRYEIGHSVPSVHREVIGSTIHWKRELGPNYQMDHRRLKTVWPIVIEDLDIVIMFEQMTLWLLVRPSQQLIKNVRVD
jgi:hypothetical protein